MDVSHAEGPGSLTRLPCAPTRADRLLCRFSQREGIRRRGLRGHAARQPGHPLTTSGTL
jgi:hypothetical protein